MTTGTAPRRAPSARVEGLGGALAALAGVAAAGAVLGLLLGPEGAVTGVLAGTGLVALFFALGAVVTGVVAAHAPGLALLVALLTYVLQVLLLGLVLVAVDRAAPAAETLQRGWLAGAVVVGTLTWVAALVVAALRTPPKPFEPPAAGGGEKSADGQVQAT